MNRAVVMVCVFVMFVASGQSRAQSPRVLKTAETKLRFANSSNGPQLLDLTTSDGTLWTNTVPEPPPDSAESDGHKVPLKWEWNPAASHFSSSEVSFVYDCASPRLRLSWNWEARANHGPIEHVVRVENLGTQELWLPLVESVRFAWKYDATSPLEHFYVEKGAGTPTPEGTHLAQLNVGYRWEGVSSTYAHTEWGGPREIIPLFLVKHSDMQQSGWYIGIEFSGRTHLTLERTDDLLTGAAGLNPNPGPFKTRLRPGDSFETPTIFLGGTTGDLDATGNIVKGWVRNVLMNPMDWHNPKYPLLVNNSWGSGMGIDEQLAMRMLHDSAELQFEMFHIDAGWFRGVGDWYPNPQKFPHGLASIADEAHRLGLKFGLWCDWTQAALDTQPGALNVRDPIVSNWAVANTPADWKPEDFKGQTIDLGVPEAQAWAEKETNRMVTDYHLDMLEHDGYVVAQGCDRANHPHAPPDPANMHIMNFASSFLVESSNSTDVSYHATRAYYAVQFLLHKNHPGLLLEMCNDGGRMVDFGSAAHGDYFSITDTYDPLSNRRAFYDTSYLLPPAMLETYVEKWPVPRIENFRYMLRSGMMGWLTIMLDTTVWSAEQHDVAKEEFDLYKHVLRPFIRDADLYHIGARPDGVHWDAVEYFDPARQSGVIYAFRGSVENENNHTFVLKGLQPGRTYQLSFHDHSSADKVAKGQDLLTSGLTIDLPTRNSSELVLVTATKP